jgi:hypothetical protein
MNTILLNKKQLSFLVDNISDPSIRREITRTLKKTSDNNGLCSIQLSDNDKFNLSQILADLLCNIGMKNDSELNPTGYLIEELIDILNPYENS